MPSHSNTPDKGLLTGRLAWTGALLMLLVTTSSAYLRLRAAGLGCVDWPACYGQGLDLKDVVGAHWIATARIVHRIAASAAGLVAILVLASLWRERARYQTQTRCALLLVGIAVGLALLGRITPKSAVPAVAVGNLLGGMGMIALFVFLACARELQAHRRHAGMTALLPIASALLVIHLSLGAMTSATYSGLACLGFPTCAGAWWPPDATLQAFNPWLASTQRTFAAQMTLQMTHRYSALLTASALLWLGGKLIARGDEAARWGVSICALVIAQLAVGVAMASLTLPLVLALAHNVLSALQLSITGALWGRGGVRDAELTQDHTHHTARFTSAR